MSYVGTANSGADSLQASRSNTKPGGAAAGDIALFYLGRWNESANFPAPSAVPSGAVLLDTLQVGLLQLLVYAKYVAGGETTYTFTWASSRWSTLESTYFSGRAQGLDLSTLARQSTTGAGTSVTSRSVTAATGDDLAWAVDCHEYNGGESHGPPTSFTEVYDQEAGSAAYRANVASGSQTASGATISASQNFAVHLVALPAAGGGGAAMDLGAAAGSGAAQGWQMAKAPILGQAAGVGAAQALAPTKALALGAAVGSGAAQVLSASKALTLGAATGVGQPQAMNFSKALELGPAAGSGAAQTAGFTAASSVELGPATGIGSPQAMSFSKALVLGTATGAGAPAAIAASKSLALGSASGTGSPQALVPGKDLGLQAATGSGAAQILGMTAAGSMALGPATGVGQPQAMAFSKALALGVAAGAGAVQALSSAKALALGTAAGAGSPRAALMSKQLALSAAQGTGTAYALALTGPLPEYIAPEDWTVATRDGDTARSAVPAATVSTRRTTYTVSTRED